MAAKSTPHLAAFLSKGQKKKKEEMEIFRYERVRSHAEGLRCDSVPPKWISPPALGTK